MVLVKAFRVVDDEELLLLVKVWDVTTNSRLPLMQKLKDKYHDDDPSFHSVVVLTTNAINGKQKKSNTN